MNFEQRAELLQRLTHLDSQVRSWFSARSQHYKIPFYGSVDIRDSGKKVAVVDTNLYPGGFNNISPLDHAAAATAITCALQQWEVTLKGPLKTVMILPESHTQNPYYVDHLEVLMKLLRQAGRHPLLGWYQPELTPEQRLQPVVLRNSTGGTLTAHPVRCDVTGALISAEGKPDVVLLNNDFSSGYPQALDCVQQLIIPAYTMGWHTRKKSEHFVHYNALVGEFSDLLGLPATGFQIETQEVEAIDFQSGQGGDRLQVAVGTVLTRLKAAHPEDPDPFVFVKSNAGTYGMGILVARDASSLQTLNRRERNKMSVIKSGLSVESVIVQEGIPTTLTFDAYPAEPVLYCIGDQVVGAFLRFNRERDHASNLNSRGMGFEPLSLSDGTAARTLPSLPLYSILARIALLATAMETAEHPYTSDSQQRKFTLY